MKTLLFFMVAHTVAHAQHSSIDSIDGLQETIESILEDEELVEEEIETMDRVTYLSENPIDLNTAGFNELQQIPGITPLHAYRIISARESGRFTRVADLLAIEGFDEELYRRVLPFVSALSPRANLPFAFQMRSRAVSDLQRRRGYEEHQYMGGREKLYLRSFLSVPFSETVGVKGGLTSEKDPGEELNAGFLSGYLCVSFPMVSIIGGDFVVSSGNDHLLARGAGLGRRQGANHVIPSAITGYQSADEQRFFRGAAVTGAMPGVSIGFFYSNKAVHGTTDDDGSLNLSTTGLFRTRAELLKRNNSRERVIGGYLSTEPLAGFSVTFAGIDAKFLQWGQSSKSFGLHGSWKARLGTISGGLTRESGGGRSVMIAGTVEPVVGSTFFVRHENFTRGFFSPYGLPRSPVPQSASAAGVNARLTRGSRITASLYREGFPEGTQGVGFSENEHGMLLEGTFSIAKDIQAELRFRMRLSPFETESLDTFGRTRTLSGIQRTRKIRVSIIAGRKTAISWISRIELSRANANGTTDPGIMLAQEFRYTPSRDLRIQVKVTLFAVDAYDARIYSFEPTVPGMFVNRALQGEGTRSALSVLYRVRSGFEISTSFSTEVQDGRRSVGSGLEEIRGDAQSRLTIQIDLRF